MSDNWYPLASLVIQLLFLVAGAWFASNILKAMRASQEQLGAMLKLSIMGVPAERHSSASANQSLTAESPYWLVPSETEAAGLPRPTERGPGRFAVVRRKMVHWLQAPMTSSQTAPWRRIISWLQAPAGS
jgi:hypothetical protein